MIALVRHSMLVIILIAATSCTNADEPYVVGHTLKWHNQHVGAYLAAVKSAELPLFDRQAATERAASAYPMLPNPPKSEFETQTEYERRRDDVAGKNVVIANKREESIAARQQEFQNRIATLRPTYENAQKKERQPFPQLLYMYPSNARPFDAESSTYPAFAQPTEALGEGNNGFADLKVGIKPQAFKCDDLALAKRIRAVSDAGHLWVLVYITNATVSIQRSSKVVDRGAMEKAGESLLKSAPEIGIALLAEYFKPGSSRNVYIPPKEVDQTKTVFGYVVSVSGTDQGYAGIYDAGNNEFLWQPK